MRVVIHGYANGGRYIYETRDDGDFVTTIDGERQPGQRIQVAIEIQCDDSEEARKAAFESIDFVRRRVTQAA